MLTSKILTTHDELEEFRQNFLSTSNLHVDHDYMRQALTRGFFDHAGVMYSGYIMNTKAQSRYLNWWFLTDKVKASPNLPDMRKVVEITCNWERPHVTTLQKILVGLHIINDFRRSKRKFLMAGTFHKKIMAMHKYPMPYDILAFDFYNDRNGQDETLYLYYGTMTTLLRSFPQLVVKKLQKQFRNRKRKRPD